MPNIRPNGFVVGQYSICSGVYKLYLSRDEGDGIVY